MTEIALVLVIFGLLGLLGFQDYNNRKERKSLVNALKSKDATDYANLELADKTNIEVKKPKEEVVIVPFSFKTTPCTLGGFHHLIYRLTHMLGLNCACLVITWFWHFLIQTY